MLAEYVPILTFLAIGVGFGIVLVGAGFLLGNLGRGGRKPDAEKDSPYECGFEAFEDTRMKFDVRYYLVAILFIIFDLEIAFLFPWAVALDAIGVVGFVAMAIFLAVLVIGFIYEWKKGALEWE
jgi:NADH-quinone oxidoreductase subunit A